MANEIRLRANNISGTTTDNPLLIGATTINSPGFVDLPTVGTTNHLILILDPLEVNGAAEIVQVTAHAASSSVCTIVRGFETTTPRQHNLGTTWFHGPVVSDYSFTQRTALSTNRPTAPFVGEQIYETDTSRWVVWNGSVWLPAPMNPPACRVFHSATVSIPNSANTILACDSERYDTDTMHDTVTNNSRITIKTAGVYVVTASVEIQANATGTRELQLLLNSTKFIAISSCQAPPATNPTLLVAASTWKFAVNDFIEMRVLQNSGVPLNLTRVDAHSPEFSATWVGVG